MLFFFDSSSGDFVKHTASTCRKNLRPRTRTKQALSFLSHLNDRHESDPPFPSFSLALFLSSLCPTVSEDFRQFLPAILRPSVVPLSLSGRASRFIATTSCVVSCFPFRCRLRRRRRRRCCSPCHFCRRFSENRQS